jgi:hypothetical protein
MRKLILLVVILCASSSAFCQATLLNTFTVHDSGAYDVTPVPNGATSMSLSVTGIDVHHPDHLGHVWTL